MTVCKECHDDLRCVACHGEGKLICSACQGSGQCHSCQGSGVTRGEHGAERCTACQGSGICVRCEHGSIVCMKCHGSGVCANCMEIRARWEQANNYLRAGDSYNAQVELENLLTKFDQRGCTNSQNANVGGMGVGAVIGTLLFPGVGTVLGGWLGRELGGRLASEMTKDWAQGFQAETYYRLGQVFESRKEIPMARQAYMKVLTLDDTHAPARDKLRVLVS